MIKFEPTDLISLSEYRTDYFDEIKFSQELFIEWQILDGNCYKILDKGNCIGYFIKSKENILLEFHLINELIYRKEDIFKNIIKQLSIFEAYCKSFDHILLTCCQTFCKSSKVIGTMFRDYSNNLLKMDRDIDVRVALQDDIPYLLSFDSELYETEDELRFTVSNQMVYMFEKEKQLIGCGYFIQILPDGFFYDIGMWVNPLFRKQGYATQIITYLKKLCLDNGRIPVCGCAADNIASRRTLEKNGFISKYCITNFNFYN